jgi:hypothetical protein
MRGRARLAGSVGCSSRATQSRCSHCSHSPRDVATRPLTAPFSFGSGTEDVGRTSHSFHHTPAWVRHLASTPEPISRKLLYEPGRCPAAPYRTAATYVVACSSSTWGSLNPLGRWFRVQGLRLLVTAYSLLACRYPCYLRCSPPDGLGFVWREKSAGGGGSGRGGGRRNAGGTWAL